MKVLFAAAGVAALVGAVVFASGGPVAESFSPYVDEKGKISLPKDFRTWYFLGTWGVAADEDDGVGSKGFHNVYTNWRRYRPSGRPGSFRMAQCW